MSTVFYLASVVLSLYAAYLFTFRTYDTDYKGQPTHLLRFTNIIYLCLWLCCFAPVINSIMLIVLVIVGQVNVVCKDIYIDSWLFRKPKEEDKDD